MRTVSGWRDGCLMMADKSGACSLRITHDALAQVVGGPRHAVTVGLNKLRADGAIAHLRGRIDILDRTRLIAEACECYGRPALNPRTSVQRCTDTPPQDR